jgi:hypothetical protein
MDDLIYDLYAPRNDATADLRRARLDRFAAAALGGVVGAIESGALKFRNVPHGADRAFFVAAQAADAAEALLAELERRELELGEVAL